MVFQEFPGGALAALDAVDDRIQTRDGAAYIVVECIVCEYLGEGAVRGIHGLHQLLRVVGDGQRLVVEPIVMQ